MRPDSGPTKSVWMATADVPPLPALVQNIHTEVCIIGAGIAGLTAAYLLTQEGRSVVVVDDGPLGGGQTQRTTAHLANAIDDRYFEIERLHGKQGARLAAASHTAAIDQIEAAVKQETIDCDFERLDGYLFAPPGQSTEVLSRELESAHRAGLREVELLERAPLRSFDTGPCLRFPLQGQFHPLKYLAGLSHAILRRGGRLFTGAHVESIKGGSPAQVKTTGGFLITAAAVVVATNTPINDRVAIHTKQAPYLTYVVGLPVPAGEIPKALYWDTLDPYHYVRLQPTPSEHGSREEAGMPGTHDLLIVGGEDHKTGQADDIEGRYRRLEAWASERFPVSGTTAYRWSGQVMETIDGLAFIGRNPFDEPNIYIATGDSGMGMTHGTIAGLLLTDLILGRDNPWAPLYDPSRKPLGALGEFTSENLNVARQYGEWLTRGDVPSLGQIAPGTGAVLRRGFTKVAVYRDEQGNLHECSAVCTHLGCVVTWNDAEKSWDCPCHGSRFDRLGRVFQGPANRDLKPVGGR